MPGRPTSAPGAKHRPPRGGSYSKLRSNGQQQPRNLFSARVPDSLIHKGRRPQGPSSIVIPR